MNIFQLIQSVKCHYETIAITGSYAIYFLLEKSKDKMNQYLEKSKDKINQYLEEIKPNDIDFCVTNHKKFDAFSDMPKQIDDYKRVQKFPSKSCTYKNNNESFDIIFVEGTLKYIVVDGINVILPKIIASEYVESLGIKGRNEILDNLKINACNFLSDIYNDYEIIIKKSIITNHEQNININKIKRILF